LVELTIMDNHTQQYQSFWNQRQKLFGNTPRSVLFKGLPESVNVAIHKKHVQFITNNLPKSTKSLLDVGCGYGRLAGEIKATRSNLKMQGIELCEEFAKKFSGDFGPCYHGSMLDYISSESFDVILFVTVLMYAQKKDLNHIIEKFWSQLNPGGILICIEPCLNFLIKWQQVKGVQNLQALYFRKQELFDLLQAQPQAVITNQKSFGLFPLLNFPILHYGFAIRKGSSS